MVPFLLLMAAAAPAVPPLVLPEHRVRLERADVRYRGTVAVAFRQVGVPAPGGRASSLRCRWSADLTVEREALAPSGRASARVIARERALEGSRPGWCDGHARAVEREVAARSDRLRRALLRIAGRDRPRLPAELDAGPPPA